MMKKHKVLIIDDEPLARTLLKEYVSKEPQLELIADCECAQSALKFLRGEKIDILLTDIEMPDITGLELIKLCKNVPSVIFISAYSEYAIDGFELNAVDYLLKPVSFSRFIQAINKAIKNIDINTNSSIILQGDSFVNSKTYISIKADYKIYKINFEDLIYIEGQSEYVTFYTISKNITAYYALKNLELELPEKMFVRIHKSYIISIKHIEYVGNNHVMVAGKKIPIGGNYKDLISKILE